MIPRPVDLGQRKDFHLTVVIDQLLASIPVLTTWIGDRPTQMKKNMSSQFDLRSKLTLKEIMKTQISEVKYSIQGLWPS